jgi:hypothetical protein
MAVVQEKILLILLHVMRVNGNVMMVDVSLKSTSVMVL